MSSIIKASYIDSDKYSVDVKDNLLRLQRRLFDNELKDDDDLRNYLSNLGRINYLYDINVDNAVNVALNNKNYDSILLSSFFRAWKRELMWGLNNSEGDRLFFAIVEAVDALCISRIDAFKHKFHVKSIANKCYSVYDQLVLSNFKDNKETYDKIVFYEYKYKINVLDVCNICK